MQSHPVIYVSRITNLSDARYCAGMGVDLLGFVVDPSHRDYVSPESYQQMIGWVAGPGRVIETGNLPLTDIETARVQYAADYVHIPASRLLEFGATPMPLIVEITLDSLRTQHQPSPNVAYWMVTDAPDQIDGTISDEKKVLIARTAFETTVASYLSKSGAAGIVLQGSQESAPGLKDYDHLSQILEELNG